jgi:hypothetical protein
MDEAPPPPPEEDEQDLEEQLPPVCIALTAKPPATHSMVKQCYVMLCYVNAWHTYCIVGSNSGCWAIRLSGNQ